MKHRRSISFKKLFDALPADIKEIAGRQFKLMQNDASHASVSFKQLGGSTNYSARVTSSYRVLGHVIADSDPKVIVWFFIGTHADYDKLNARGGHTK